MSGGLGELNAMAADRAAVMFASCCGATRWVRAMVERRPFSSREALAAAADEVWWSLSPDDWREAFSHHPRIGERTASAAATDQSARWSSGEQARVADAGESARAELAAANAEYERRFGFTYIVRASGRSAADMLEMARRRLTNDAGTELRVAAEQQREITQLRLKKLLDGMETT